jgi:SAM-dependent methyltransferase
MSAVGVEPARGSLVANRAFYDALWSKSYLVAPQRFNTWPSLSALAAAAPARLEVGPGLRPRLPLARTHFVDVSRAALRHLQARGGFAWLGDISSLPFADRSFDLICAFDIVEHVDQDRRALAEICRVARPDAAVILSVPLHPARWTAFDDLVGHVRRYTPDALIALLAEHALVLEHSVGFGMEPRSRWVQEFAAWMLTRQPRRAMRWYNRVFLPLGLLLQKRLDWMPGLIDLTTTDELVLICRRGTPATSSTPLG